MMSVIQLSVDMQNVPVLYVVMKVIMPSAVMLSVIMPKCQHTECRNDE